MIAKGKSGQARWRSLTKRAAVPTHRRGECKKLTREEQDLLGRQAYGSWSVDNIRACRDGGNFVGLPSEATLRIQARRAKLAGAGRPVLRVTLPPLKRPLTPERLAQLDRIDRLRESIGKVDFTTAELIREMRDDGADVRR